MNEIILLQEIRQHSEKNGFKYHPSVYYYSLIKILQLSKKVNFLHIIISFKTTVQFGQ